MIVGCGEVDIDRIIGGQQVGDGEVPWMCAIMRYGSVLTKKHAVHLLSTGLTTDGGGVVPLSWVATLSSL